MAKNLIKSTTLKKESVMVFDLNKDMMRSTVGEHGVMAGSIAELAAKCNYIITMLPATAHVTSVLTDATDGVFRHAKAGTMIIDSSTIDPIASKALHQQAVELSLRMLDAPVSGGVTGAEAGTLTFMVGGELATIDDARDLFAAMGKNVVHCGGAGSGGVTKLCNNLALAIQMIGTAEAMALGQKLGMDSATLAAVMNSSTARCWSSDAYNPVPGVMAGVPASRGYAGGFGNALMYKDLGLALGAAGAVDQFLPLGSRAAQMYGKLSGPQSAYKDLDFGSVYQYLATDSQAGKEQPLK